MKVMDLKCGFWLFFSHSFHLMPGCTEGMISCTNIYRSRTTDEFWNLSHMTTICSSQGDVASCFEWGKCCGAAQRRKRKWGKAPFSFPFLPLFICAAIRLQLTLDKGLSKQSKKHADKGCIQSVMTSQRRGGNHHVDCCFTFQQFSTFLMSGVKRSTWTIPFLLQTHTRTCRGFLLTDKNASILYRRAMDPSPGVVCV